MPACGVCDEALPRFAVHSTPGVGTEGAAEDYINICGVLSSEKITDIPYSSSEIDRLLTLRVDDSIVYTPRL
jgi:hypothetical protein